MTAYPVKVTTLWHQASQGLLLGAVIAQVNSWLQGAPFAWPDTLPYMGVTAFVVTVFYFFQPTVCGPQGMKVMTVWGYRKSIAWEQIAQVTLARLYFLQPSLRLTDAQGRTYWISRDTKDIKGLYADTVKFGGTNHPLARALQTPLFEL